MRSNSAIWGTEHATTTTLGSKALALGVALFFSVVACKTSSHEDASVQSLKSTEGGHCGPHKTYYFHWASAEAAKNWIEGASGSQGNLSSQLLPAGSPGYPMNEKLMWTLKHNSNNLANVLGAAVYLAFGPLETHKWGDTLLIFRFRDRQGKGLPCQDWSGGNDLAVKARLNKIANPSDLPIFIQYRNSLTERWYIAPRAADESQGENVVFNLPQAGDAEAFTTELMTSVTTIDEFLVQFTGIHFDNIPYSSELSTRDLCNGKRSNSSETFLQELYCRTLVKKFAQVLSTANPASLAPETKQKLAKFALAYDKQFMNLPEMAAVIKHFDPDF